MNSQKFTDGTVNDQNGSEFKDVMAGLDHILAKTPYLDAERLGARLDKAERRLSALLHHLAELTREDELAHARRATRHRVERRVGLVGEW